MILFLSSDHLILLPLLMDHTLIFLVNKENDKNDLKNLVFMLCYFSPLPNLVEVHKLLMYFYISY